MKETIYLRMYHRLKVVPDSTIQLGQMAQIVVSTEPVYKKLTELEVHQIVEADQSIVVIDVMQVIDQIQQLFPGVDIQTIGPTQTLIEIVYPKKTMKLASFILVWILLFIGSGLAIMNFHEDVSMQEVHQSIYYMITGKKESKPLLLQIPYSFGLGLGMILFFNHLFKKRINEEPSPLEVEMFKYQQDLDQYTVMNEREKHGH